MSDNVLPPRIVHMTIPGAGYAPLCGQVALGGKDYTKSPKTTDPAEVTCKKCLKRLERRGP